MSSWKQQALIDAPLVRVWELLEDPERYNEWNEGTIAVTGVPTEIEKGSTFSVTSKGPLGIKATTTFEVEALDDLHEIRMRCQASGYYSHWVLTEARGGTFTDLELGIEPESGLQVKAVAALHTKRYLRRAVEHTLDELNRFFAPQGRK